MLSLSATYECDVVVPELLHMVVQLTVFVVAFPSKL